MPVIRVLLVDDHPVVRIGLRAMINSESDMDVVGEAENGHQAVTQAKVLTPDVIVMDISMPEMDGLEASRQILDSDLDTQVLILTVHAHERYLFPVLKAGAAGYVLKSTVDTQLIDAIRTVARGGVFLYPEAARMVLEDYMGRGSADQDIHELLSDRERQVLKMVALGHTSSEIADKLVLSPKTVDTYRTRIMQKLELHSRVDLVKYALSRGLLSEYTT